MFLDSVNNDVTVWGMDDRNDSRWTISELAAKAADVLSREEVDQASARVSEIPSTRTLRFYTTHGLLDRPVDFRGRTALYAHRHLLQIIAIKRLQAGGASLQEIQANLMAIRDAELETLAAIEKGEEAAAARGGGAFASGGSRERGEETGERSDGSFWMRASEQDERDARDGGETAKRAADRGSDAGVVQGVKLGGVTLMFDEPSPALLEDDLEAIRDAAEPLIKLLKSRGLVARHKTGGGSDECDFDDGRR